ncbi:zinc finger protein 596-like isoform X2 [Ptychodera flava]|uniref:zinc finger protein 596-like isoform X2 n=1 Tax=Ptychodera flava TaxID=63121 RepID=UPI00396A1723
MEKPTTDSDFKKIPHRRSRDHCRIRLGHQFVRWENLKAILGMSTHRDMAQILLDSYESQQDTGMTNSSQTAPATEDKGDEQTQSKRRERMRRLAVYSGLKRKQNTTSRDHGRIRIGDQFKRWQDLKTQLGDPLHPDMARQLLDSYDNHGDTGTADSSQTATVTGDIGDKGPESERTFMRSADGGPQENAFQKIMDVLVPQFMAEDGRKTHYMDTKGLTKSDLHSSEDLKGKDEMMNFDELIQNDTSQNSKGLFQSMQAYLICKGCKVSFVSHRKLRKHLIQNDLGEKNRVVCEVCNLTMRYMCQFRGHDPEHEWNVMMKCDTCDFKTDTKYLLRHHYLRSHATDAEKCFVCPWEDCEMKYAVEYDLKAHIRAHKKDVVCHICGKVQNKHFFNQHLQREHGAAKTPKGDNTILCEFCGKQYSANSMGNFRSHLLKHQQIKPFKCRYCGKRFVANNFLLNHERIHTGEKPYKCSMCDAAFAKRSQLVSHGRTHTGEKPYKCTLCSYESCWNIQLKHHMKAHGSATEVTCDICSISFVSDQSLRIHERKQHFITKNM